MLQLGLLQEPPFKNPLKNINMVDYSGRRFLIEKMPTQIIFRKFRFNFFKSPNEITIESPLNPLKIPTKSHWKNPMKIPYSDIAIPSDHSRHSHSIPSPGRCPGGGGGACACACAAWPAGHCLSKARGGCGGGCWIWSEASGVFKPTNINSQTRKAAKSAKRCGDLNSKDMQRLKCLSSLSLRNRERSGDWEILEVQRWQHAWRSIPMNSLTCLQLAGPPGVFIDPILVSTCI